LPGIAGFDKNTLYGSDCGGYLDYKYLMSCQNGEEIVEGFSRILNVPVELIRDTPGAGAQFVWRASAGLWWHIWQDSLLLYEFLRPVRSDVQKWTAEMWAQLYNFAKFGYEVEISPELEFCRPTDEVAEWERVKILHNAGVMSGDEGLFYKGEYLDRSPLGLTHRVRQDKVSARYVDAIGKVV
jgi:hypothetical protein